MRCQAIVWGLLVGLAAMVGCKQQCFMPECDYDHYRSLMPQHLDCKAATHIQPEAADVPEPPTVLNPERKIRYLALAEAMAIALEQGTRGLQGGFPEPSGLINGFVRELPLQFTGREVTGSDAIRVLALQPAIAATDIEAALSKFDARWVTSLSWTTNDRPVGTALDTFQTFGGQNTIQQQLATFNTSMIKPLPTGGVAGITFNTDYEFSNLNQRVNPSYRPTLRFGIEQPLLQGFGTEINQLRSAHPGSSLFQFTNLARTEGILLTRLRFDQTRAQFEFDVGLMVFSVEAAYWNLYGAYWNLYSREEALRQAFGTWRINKLQFDAGRVSILELAQSRAQYELFRGQRITALGRVLDLERQLRTLLGLPAEDGTRLVPIDSPTVAPYAPDWQAALTEAMTLQPTLVLGRQDVKSKQLELINEKNLLLPDIRLGATYDFNAIGSRLDGPSALNAYRNLGDGDFSNWNINLRAEIPFGYRDAHAGVRRSRLQLAQSYQQLRDQELKVQRFLAREYANIFEFHERIKSSRAEREAFAQELAARFEQFRAGKVTMNFLLEAQRNWADALSREYQTIVEYNHVLAAFEFAKGTILQYNNVVIAEGALPKCAQVRATEHFRERSKALVLRERPDLGDGAGCCPDKACPSGGCAESPQPIAASLPALPETPPSLLTLWKNAGPVPEIKEPLPTGPNTVLSLSKPAGPSAAELPITAPVNPPKTITFTNGGNLPPITPPLAQPTPGRNGSFTNETTGVVPAGFTLPSGEPARHEPR